jgi:hypothetical protein
LTSRPYAGEADLQPMLEFLSSATSTAPPGAYWHPGDVIWGMYQNTVFDPTVGYDSGKTATNYSALPGSKNRTAW